MRKAFPSSIIFVLGLTEQNREGRDRIDEAPMPRTIPHTECDKAAMRCNATAYFEVSFDDPDGVKEVMSRILGYTAAKQFVKPEVAHEPASEGDCVKHKRFQNLRLFKRP